MVSNSTHAIFFLLKALVITKVFENHFGVSVKTETKIKPARVIGHGLIGSIG